MEVLNSGLVIVGAYDDKVRRTLFGIVREVEPKELAKAAGELNRFLFKLLVEELGLDKGDVVRVRVPFDVRNGEIVWDLSNIEVEAFKRIGQKEVKEAIGRLLSKYKPKERVVEYEFRPKMETLAGETVYEILLNGKVVGMAKSDGKTVKGAVIQPLPRIFEGAIELGLEENVKRGSLVNKKKAKEFIENLGFSLTTI